MVAKVRNVEEYLRELERNKGEKPDQVKDALEAYVDLWRRAIEKGIVSQTDEITEALAKIEEKGGLYQAAE